MTETIARPSKRVAKELAASTGFLLARLGFGFKGKAIAMAEREGFELYDYSVLAILAEGDRETQSAIAGAMNLDPSRLVALLDSLETRGLIARQRDPQDRRRHVVSITPAGQQQLEQIRALFKGLEEEFLAPLDAEDRATLQRLLIQLAIRNEPGCFGGDE
jgi:MarR family transcriptional regulator, lower aerobic nicotinate degradation pathway regulator